MYRFIRFTITMMTLATCWAYGQRVGTVSPVNYSLAKIEDGFFVSWQPVSRDSAKDQIEIFNNSQLVGHANLLKALPEAAKVGIYDVAVRKDKIAVAAVFVSRGPERKALRAATLLLFDFSGRLLSVYALAPDRQIYKLVIDDQSNIWTMTDHSGDKGPAHTPMVVEYSSEGAVLRNVLTRSTFPSLASKMLETPDTGMITMGYDAGAVWFWLPVSTDLVTISTDGKAKVTKTGLPKKEGKTEVPLAMARDGSGNLVVEFREDKPDGGYDLAYYTWFPASESWTRFRPGSCEGARFIGIFGGEQLYAQAHDQNDLASYDICAFRASAKEPPEAVH